MTILTNSKAINSSHQLKSNSFSIAQLVLKNELRDQPKCQETFDEKHYDHETENEMVSEDEESSKAIIHSVCSFFYLLLIYSHLNLISTFDCPRF